MDSKQEIRERIWKKLVDENVDRFPKPIKGRIPNFDGSNIAAEKLTEVSEFKSSKVIKVNPDYAQISVRKAVLDEGKKLIMPTPRLREGFLFLDPNKIEIDDYRKASTIKHSFRFGEKISPEDIPEIDLIVCGSVAVTEEGVRVGKGGGYSDLEFAILVELGKIRKEIVICTTVHDLQVIDEAPVSDHDFTVNIISTPNRVVKAEGKWNRPVGILWDILPEEKISQIPILEKLRA
ncbi:5-formyltetrahydrofolate cyclo-ligase [Candidatus Bathyarchaeota archaeon]|nr:5-formyltetrahydrofolate cyclo-ligase [Candidatus Bathyarchaeota archaeon]